jgi:hypothetical protein
MNHRTKSVLLIGGLAVATVAVLTVALATVVDPYNYCETAGRSPEEESRQQQRDRQKPETDHTSRKSCLIFKSLRDPTQGPYRSSSPLQPTHALVKHAIASKNNGGENGQGNFKEFRRGIGETPQAISDRRQVAGGMLRGDAQRLPSQASRRGV